MSSITPKTIRTPNTSSSPNTSITPKTIRTPNTSSSHDTDVRTAVEGDTWMCYFDKEKKSKKVDGKEIIILKVFVIGLNDSNIICEDVSKHTWKSATGLSNIRIANKGEKWKCDGKEFTVSCFNVTGKINGKLILVSDIDLYEWEVKTRKETKERKNAEEAKKEAKKEAEKNAKESKEAMIKEAIGQSLGGKRIHRSRRSRRSRTKKYKNRSRKYKTTTNLKILYE